MGQYYKIVNLDKREYLDPRGLGDGAKLMELSDALVALAVLCASGNGRGGGDCCSARPIVGSWAGDRIVVAGDYGDGGAFFTDEDRLWAETQYGRDAKDVGLYTLAAVCFRDVTAEAARMLIDDRGR